MHDCIAILEGVQQVTADISVNARVPMLSLSTVVLLIVGIGKKLYGFRKISRFKNQHFNRLYPKKPAGMHW